MSNITTAQVREALGLPADNPNIGIEIDWDGSDFKNSDCNVDDHLPAAVHVDWMKPHFDPDTDRLRGMYLEEEAFSWLHAPTALAEIVEEVAPFDREDDYLVKIVVNGWYLRYALQAAA